MQQDHQTSIDNLQRQVGMLLAVNHHLLGVVESLSEGRAVDPVDVERLRLQQRVMKRLREPQPDTHAH